MPGLLRWRGLGDLKQASEVLDAIRKRQPVRTITCSWSASCGSRLATTLARLPLSIAPCRSIRRCPRLITTPALPTSLGALARSGEMSFRPSWRCVPMIPTRSTIWDSSISSRQKVEDAWTSSSK